jgi:hypothetical protein
MITLQDCNSSHIKSFGYDDSEWVLTVVFRSTGETKRYGEFPPELYDAFEKAESKGKFFNQHIMRQFPVLRSDEPPIEAYDTALRNFAETGNPFPGQDDHDQMQADIDALEASWVRDGKIQVPTPRENMAVTGLRIEEVPQPDQIITPAEQETLEAPAKAQPQVEKLKKEWALLAPAATVPLVVRDSTHYTEIADKLKRKVGLRDMVFNLLDPARDAVYKAYQAIQKRQKEILDPMDASIRADKEALLRYTQEQERIAREKQREAQRLADEEAERDRVARTEALRLQMASEQAEAGLNEEAEATLFDNTIQAAPLPAYAPRMSVETPVVEGIGKARKNWVAVVDDFEALVLDVAAGLQEMKKTGKLNGHAPITMLLPNEPQLNKRAKSDEANMQIPGVHAENKPSMSVRR